MTTASAKKLIVCTAICVLVLVLVPAALTSGCSNTKTTTTTTAVETTTTTGAVDTSTTSTSEEETTTTTTSFPPTLSRDQTDPRFSYAGTWQTISATAASGKSLAVANKSGCSMTVRFYGTGASWIAKKSPAYGQATVTVDNGQAQTVDLYNASTVWKKTVWENKTLTLNDHVLTIAWTGKKSSGATDTNINIDAIVITGVITGTYEQSASKLKYAGTWQKSTSSAVSGGSYATADASGASVTVRFSGVRLVWMARMGPGYGQAKVTIDDTTTKTVDLYATTVETKQSVYDTGVLPMGTHTVKIEWLGTKVAASKGTGITVDAFVVTGSLK